MADQEDNVVHLRGRVSGVADQRELPSGDRLVTIRVVVDRPPVRGRRAQGQSRAVVDTIDIACWTAATRRVATGLAVAEVVEVDGALRRRFFRAGGTPTSRYEVEAARVRRVRTGAAARADPPLRTAAAGS